MISFRNKIRPSDCYSCHICCASDSVHGIIDRPQSGSVHRKKAMNRRDLSSWGSDPRSVVHRASAQAGELFARMVTGRAVAAAPCVIRPYIEHGCRQRARHGDRSAVGFPLPARSRQRPRMIWTWRRPHAPLAISPHRRSLSAASWWCVVRWKDEGSSSAHPARCCIFHLQYFFLALLQRADGDDLQRSAPMYI